MHDMTEVRNDDVNRNCGSFFIVSELLKIFIVISMNVASIKIFNLKTL